MRETLTLTEATKIARRIRATYSAVSVDSIRPTYYECDEWEIKCHHSGWLGSFTISCPDDWAERRLGLSASA